MNEFVISGLIVADGELAAGEDGARRNAELMGASLALVEAPRRERVDGATLAQVVTFAGKSSA